MKNLNDIEEAQNYLEEARVQSISLSSKLNLHIVSLLDDEPMYIGGEISFGRPVKYIYPDGEISYQNGYGCNCGLASNVVQLNIEDKIRLLEYLL